MVINFTITPEERSLLLDLLRRSTRAYEALPHPTQKQAERAGTMCVLLNKLTKGN